MIMFFKHRKTKGRLSPVGLLPLAALMAASCASLPHFQKAQAPTTMLAMGGAICRNEATQIYFSSKDASLSIAAREVIEGLGARLKQCSERSVVLVAISGNDGPPALPRVVADRLSAVREALISQAVSPNRIETITEGSIVERIERGPIGGVVILTRP
jgi:outer membrane protein OmpA-like peptidoglycan-associated protein